MPRAPQKNVPALRWLDRAGPSGWVVYMLRCADDTLYSGCSNHLARRLRQHAAGRVKYTRSRRPIALAYCEPALDRSAALRREAALKRLTRQQKLQLVTQTPWPGNPQKPVDD